MRTAREIVNEVHMECSFYNCQSWQIISALSVERGVKECIEDIIEKLHDIETISELKTFISKLETIV